MLNITVLVSGGGTNLQALLDAIADGRIQNGRITQVISSKPGVYALTRAEENNIPSTVVSRKQYDDIGAYCAALKLEIDRAAPDLIVLAGFLSILSPEIVTEYAGKIINIHPALIPSFSGKGYYGLRVHEAVLARGVKITGATTHFVNEVPDGGTIIAQKAVEVLPGDTAEQLQRRVMEQAEWFLLPDAVSRFCAGTLRETQGSK